MCNRRLRPVRLRRMTYCGCSGVITSPSRHGCTIRCAFHRSIERWDAPASAVSGLGRGRLIRDDGPMSEPNRRYLEPDWFTRNIFNPTVKALTKVGVSFWGSRILEVRGRKSGEWRSVPVNLLSIDGADYLLAPRGETQWVRNLRAAGDGRLRVGQRVTEFEAEELEDSAKPEILRPYLERWKWEVGQFFEGVGPDASEDELVAIAPNHPVFRIRYRA